MRRTTGSLVGAVASIVLCTSCSSSTDGRTAPTGPNAVVNAATANTAAAELRAGLTYLLTEHVYLTGLAAQAVEVARGNLKDPVVVAALATLRANGDGLAVAMTARTPAAHDAFRQVWEERTMLFVAYAVARGQHDDAQTVRLRTALDTSRRAVAQTIHDFVRELPVAKVSDELSGYSAGLLNVIDDQVSKPSALSHDLAEAAARMPGVAALLAGGIALDKSLP